MRNKRHIIIAVFSVLILIAGGLFVLSEFRGQDLSKTALPSGQEPGNTDSDAEDASDELKTPPDEAISPGSAVTENTESEPLEEPDGLENPDGEPLAPGVEDNSDDADPGQTDENTYSDGDNNSDGNTNIQEQPQTQYESSTVRICIGGDTSIDSEFADAARRWGVDYPWKEVSQVFNEADISVVNLETCVSERGVSEKREGFGFRTPPDMLEGFVNAGIDLVCLANNHTRDYGMDALVDTFSHLAEYGIGYFGAGHDKEEAGGLTVKEVNGVKVGFAGCNYIYLSSDCAADVGHPGINMVYKLDDERTAWFLDRIKEYDSQCDVLIVFMHCGTEEVFDVGSYQKRLARALIDSGADIVIGAHPHTLQPIEFYNGKPIFYSIGNLIFWHVDDEIDGLTCIFDITIDKDGFKSLRLHPLFIKNYKVYYLERDEGKYPARYDQILELMNSLCYDYGIYFDEQGYMGLIDELSQEERDLLEAMYTENTENNADDVTLKEG